MQMAIKIVEIRIMVRAGPSNRWSPAPGKRESVQAPPLRPTRRGELITNVDSKG
jgi:hypothetical protein